MHRAVAGFSSTALDVTQLGQIQGGSFTFTCKGYKRVEFLVRELADLREMLVGTKRTVTGHGLEEKGGERGDREVGLEEQEKGEGFLAPDKGEIRTEEGKEICAGATLMATHAYTRNPERKGDRKGDRSTVMGDTHLQGRTRRERTLEASRRQTWTSKIRTSSVPGGNPRHDCSGRGKRCYQEGTRGQYKGKPDWRMDWTGGRTKEELFSSSDRWHQEKL